MISKKRYKAYTSVHWGLKKNNLSFKPLPFDTKKLDKMLKKCYSNNLETAKKRTAKYYGKIIEEILSHNIGYITFIKLYIMDSKETKAVYDIAKHIATIWDMYKGDKKI